MVAFLVFFSICASAAPDSLGPNSGGNSNSLISVKRPESLSATTSERTYTASVAGIPGVEVTIYRKSNFDGIFYKVYQGGYLLQETIGASGVYVVSIQLIEGKNQMKFYAENQNERQIINVDLTRISQSQLNKIKDITIGGVFAI